MNSIQLGKFLGWFSLGLGLAEMAAPRRLTRGLGLPVSPAVVRLFGMREVGAGLAVLTYPGSPGPVWARVGGDALDLAVLAAALGQGGRRQRNRALLSTMAVLGVTALDIACAAALTRRQTRAAQTARRTRIRQSVRYVPYADGVETPAADEAEVIGSIIQAMTKESQTAAARDGKTVRASHAKSTGLLKGALRVLDGLPPALAQGLFAKPGTHPVVVRLAQGPGEVLSDSVSTHRGMAIKVFGVDGPKLPGHEGNDTQDFVLATGTAFAQSSASTFLVAMKGLEKSTPLPELAKQVVSTASRAANTVVRAVGGDSPTLSFFGHTKRNPLADTYFSQAAIRYGDYVAKVGVFPVSPDLVAMVDQTLDTGADHDAFRTAVVTHMQAHGAEFELRVQLCTDLERMPVEDASVPWPEDESPYVAVARLTLPQQDAYSPARQAFFDDVLSFQPAHALQVHRPLGSLMRARLATYQALSAYRHEQNHQKQVEPSGVDQVPD